MPQSSFSHGPAWRCAAGGRSWRLQRMEAPDRIGALVQFEGENNRGWYDIGLEQLKVVEKPQPKPAATKS